jgi:hypothetical protein
MGQERALLWNPVAGCVPPENHVGRTGSDGHRKRFMITGIRSGRAPVGARLECRCIAGRGGASRAGRTPPSRSGTPVVPRPRRWHQSANRKCPTLMPPGILRVPRAAAARSARSTWVCVDMHTECASPETHLRANVSRRLKRDVANCEQPTEQPTHWAITDPCHVHGTGHAVPSLGGRHAYDS